MIDRSEDLELNSSHLEQLEEVSQAARLVRNQLAQNLQVETARHDDLQRKSKFSAWTRGILVRTVTIYAPSEIHTPHSQWSPRNPGTRPSFTAASLSNYY